MAEKIHESTQYRLRAGSPMPVMQKGRFVLHTFMAETSKIEFISCTEELPGSSQFRGQGGDLMTAKFSQLSVKGGGVFSGQRTYPPIYVDEDSI